MMECNIKHSAFLTIPPELRVMIYALLLDTGPGRVLTVRNMTEIGDRVRSGTLRRSAYNIAVRCDGRRENLRSTYVHGEDANLSALALMRANRQIYTEMAAYLYGTHVFDFGRDIEAVIPFLRDRNPWCRSLFREIRLRVRSPLASVGWMSDQGVWSKVYRYLETIGSLRTLTIIVEAGRADDAAFSCGRGEGDGEGDGPMDWAINLPEVGVVKEIRVVYQAEEDEPSRLVREAPTGQVPFPMVTGSEVGIDHPFLVPLALLAVVGSGFSWVGGVSAN
jgi:hypothetical protein